MRSGRGVIGLVLVVAVAAGIGGIVAGRYIESPEEAAASAEPPEASLITVPVELRELSSSVVVRGDVVFSDSSDIAPVVTGAGVVTRIAPAVGDIVNEGDVLVELEGRPVFALEGDLPMFRTMGPGVEGDDVLQLEEALLRMGYIPGVVDGIYDVLTEGALEVFYRDAGYTAVGLRPDEQASLDGAEQQLKDAQTRLQDAKDALADASKPIAESTRLSEAQAQQQAEDEVTDARDHRLQDNLDAATAVTEAQTSLNQATTARDTARVRLASAQEGVNPDGTAPVDEFLLAELGAELTAAEATLVDAQSILDTAKASVPTIATAGDDAVSAAQTSLAIHNATVVEIRTERSDVTSFQQAVTDAETDLATEQEAWDKINAELGVTVPEAEIIFLEGLPRRVSASPGGTGRHRHRLHHGGVWHRGTCRVLHRRRRPSVGQRGRHRHRLRHRARHRVEAEITFLADSTGGTVDSSRYAMRLVPTGDVPEGARTTTSRSPSPSQRRAARCWPFPWLPSRPPETTGSASK